MSGEHFDTIVLGAGQRGLCAALRELRQDRRVVIVEAAPRPGGSMQSQRSNGFVCELGPFAFERGEIDAMRAVLRVPPPPLPCDERARLGWLFDGNGLLPIPVEPVPICFRSGAEEWVQACRRELGESMRLGRAAIDVAHDGTQFEVTLGGEVAATLPAKSLVVALPLAAAGRLLARFDARLGDAAARVEHRAHAFVFLGAAEPEAPELRGYGAVPGDGVESPVAEFVYCTQVFANRALPGRVLVRAELAGAAAHGDDAAVVACAVDELRRWTRTRATFGFTKVHRFATELASGATAECRARLHELVTRVPGLSLAQL